MFLYLNDQFGHICHTYHYLNIKHMYLYKYVIYKLYIYA